MKTPLFSLLLMVIFRMATAQVNVPVFSTRSDSSEYAALQKELNRQFQKKDRTMADMKSIDSLVKLQSVLRNKIVGYKTIYSPAEDFTPSDSLVVMDPSKVTQLSVSGWTHKKLPKEVYRCRALRELELVNTRIKKLPRKLSALSSLTKIYVYNNSPKRHLRLGKNSHVVDFIIRGTEEPHLPKTYKSLSALVNLDLSQNIALSHFPEISRNGSLKKLNLISNVVTLEDLEGKSNSSLEELNIQKNHVKVVPASIANFPALKKLTLNYNAVEQVDPAFGKLQNLEEVSFYQNKLQAIAEAIYKIHGLKVIDLYFNKITKLEPELVNLKNLEILYLSNNELTALPENIGEMTRLEELYLHNNKLSYLPDSFEKLNKIRVLRINNNYFTSFPNPILKLTSLENLDVSKNNLRNFPMELGSFNKLQILALINNPWENPDDVIEVALKLHKQGTIVHVDGEFVLDEEAKE